MRFFAALTDWESLRVNTAEVKPATNPPDIELHRSNAETEMDAATFDSQRS